MGMSSGLTKWFAVVVTKWEIGRTAIATHGGFTGRYVSVEVRVLLLNSSARAIKVVLVAMPIATGVVVRRAQAALLPTVPDSPSGAPVASYCQ
jgi:hypothetical protein